MKYFHIITIWQRRPEILKTPLLTVVMLYFRRCNINNHVRRVPTNTNFSWCLFLVPKSKPLTDLFFFVWLRVCFLWIFSGFPVTLFVFVLFSVFSVVFGGEICWIIMDYEMYVFPELLAYYDPSLVSIFGIILNGQFAVDTTL